MDKKVVGTIGLAVFGMIVGMVTIISRSHEQHKEHQTEVQFLETHCIVTGDAREVVKGGRLALRTVYQCDDGTMRLR